MSSARSRLALVTSLGSASRGVGRCVEVLPVSAHLFRLGAATIGGLAMVRLLFSSRRRSKVSAPSAVAPAANSGLGRQLLSETVLTLLLPLCRHYVLGEGSPLAARIDNFLKGRR